MTVTVLGLLKQCPECKGEKLLSVATAQGTNFFCRDCVLCWRVEHGQVHVVDPQTCPGCQLGTTACYERWQYPLAVAEIPSMIMRRGIAALCRPGQPNDADIEAELYCSAREAGIGSFAVEGG